MMYQPYKSGYPIHFEELPFRFPPTTKNELTDEVVKTVKGIVKSKMKETTTHKMITSTITETSTNLVTKGISEVSTEIIDKTTEFVTNPPVTINLSENATLNILELSENSTASVISSVQELNNTVLMETVNTNNTMINLNNTMLSDTNNTFLDFNATMESESGTISSVTENVTKPIMDWMNFGEEHWNLTSIKSQDETYPDQTLFIILGVIIGALIVITIILSLIYITYKKRNSYALQERTSQSKPSTSSGRELDCDSDIMLHIDQKSGYKF